MTAINSGDPQVAVRLREIELQNKVDLQRLALQGDAAHLQDKQSARARQTASEQATGTRDVNMYVLAYLFLGGFFTSTIIVMWLAFSGNMPDNIPQAVVFLLGNLIGTLSAGVLAILQYFYGSSKSSNTKTELLANLNAK
jgi:hypothetical protein